MPRVSIITPVYNAANDLFDRTIKSIESQTSNDFEWIVVDDGSDPNIYTRWRDVRLEGNYGASVARNVGFQISSGDIITYLDMGDELDLSRVENLIKLYDSYKVELSFCGYNIVQGSLTYPFSPFDWIGKTMSAIDYVQLLRTQNISIPMGVSHTRKPFVECGGFQRGIVCGEDGILWRRMLDKVASDRIIISDDVAGTYFISETGQSRTQRRPEMGGFAFNGDLKDNGKYLDESWYRTYSSEGLYE